jgi:hypothetical protein
VLDTSKFWYVRGSSERKSEIPGSSCGSWCTTGEDETGRTNTHEDWLWGVAHQLEQVHGIFGDQVGFVVGLSLLRSHCRGKFWDGDGVRARDNQLERGDLDTETES